MALAFTVLLVCDAWAQTPFTLTFTGVKEDGTYVRMDYVEVTNVTRGWTETLYFPDTVFVTSGVGINEHSDLRSVLSQNTPNPFDGVTEFTVQLPEAQNVTMEITGLNGRVVARHDASYGPGTHRFRATLGTAQSYILRVRIGEDWQQIKMVNIGAGKANRIEYVGGGSSVNTPSDTKGHSLYPFELGDVLKYVGYSTYNSGLIVASNPIQKAQAENETVTLEFPMLAPCAVSASHPAQTGALYHSNGHNGANYGLETETGNGMIKSVTDYDGNEYPVVQIGSQCWLAENMRCTHSPSTGTYIVENSYVFTNNYTNTGKQARWISGMVYMYDDWVVFDSADCVAHHFGLLYNWNAAVDVYNTSFGELSINTDNPVDTTFSDYCQGICPMGWHVPSDEEWTTMEISVYGSNLSSTTGYRGSHAGKLAGGDDWGTSNAVNSPGDYTNPERNSSGFSAVPGGTFYSQFMSVGSEADFWTSTQNDTNKNCAYFRDLQIDNAGVGRFRNNSKFQGFSVRCLRN